MAVKFTETYRNTGLRTLDEGEKRVDRETNVLRGIKLLGYESKNDEGRRRYVKPKASLYENIPVNLNHPEMFSDSKVQDRWGVVQKGTVRVEADGVFGDVEYNPHHPMTESILWWAEKHADQMGMSHVAYGYQEEIDGKIWITVEGVESVDLVTRPATTKGFHEAHNKETGQMDFEKLYKEALAKETETALALSKASEAKAVAEQALIAEKAAHEATKAEHAKAEALRAREALLADAKLGEIAESFKTAILNAESDEAAKSLIEAVKGQVSGKPKSVSTESVKSADAKGDEPKTYEQIKESGTLDYRRVV